jgi:hypothetical protein
MLFLKHGGRVLEEDDQRAQELDRTVEGVALAHSVAPRVAAALKKGETTPFDYLLSQIVGDADAHLPADDPVALVDSLNALGNAMAEQSPPPATQNSTIPPIYTYWGQFIDHDLTANTDRDSAVSDITKAGVKPLDPKFVVTNLRNLRRPTLDLDSVYGDGPGLLGNRGQDAGFYEGPRFRIGRNTDNAPGTPPDAGIPGVKIPPDGDLDRDLPRIGVLLDAGVIQEDDFTPEQRANVNFRTRAFIGDARNDENLIIAQFHLAFLRFHNRVVDSIASNYVGGFGYRRNAEVFERARRLTRWHYQWLVVHDYLKTVTLPGITDKVLLGGPKFYVPRKGRLFMPLEYSVAAFRFGHSMVRAAYDHNRNFGKNGTNQGVVAPFASFDQFFLFTGNGFQRDNAGAVAPNPFLGAPSLPFNWIVEWDRFTEKGSPDPTHFARKIDTHLAPPLLDLVNEGNSQGLNAGIRGLLKHLARRNLTRGYLLSIPTGQAAAQAMGVVPLTEAQLRQGNSAAVDEALDRGGFAHRTPLWYYLLKEAEVEANGNSLGELGSRIVCETLIGLLRHDPNSYLSQRGWGPEDGVRLDGGDPIVTVRDFLRFASVAD